ncbi:uncharacterized protein LOC110114245 [Dendrobium catenatum]|uniref:Uncharacterized protein n=1 Tax=Dendrobium catenatum TaxID=906689 RepID=A0A2I0WYP9_9ASPA|nr:uncharacterized protein LOC110114245 [Dendrobium catenatum]PKU80789.1 hypothetical protein MA16_Dca014627 [Dendrobium catenatum]
MGASESVASKLNQQPPIDQITTVSERIENADPMLERIQALKIATPLLRSQTPSEGSLTDILVRKPSSSSNSNIPGSLNPNVLLELFSTYRDWQVEKAKKISKRQEEIENKIETADALAGKLLQRFNHSASSMRTTAHSLTEVHQLQIEVGELKGRLTEVISNCDALCKRIAAEGPESLRRSAVPFAARGISSTNHFSSRNKS